MPSNEDYRKVVNTLKGQLGRKPFLTISRMEITEILRSESGEPRTRVKHLVAAAIEREMERAGLRCYPSLIDTEGKDMLRLFRSPSFIAELTTILNEPGEETDARLRDAIKKVDLSAGSAVEFTSVA